MRTLVLVGTLAFGTVGCGALSAILPIVADIITVVTEASQVLDVIEETADRYFASHPNPDAEQKYAKALRQARLALGAAMKAAHGAENLDKGKVDAALDAFSQAYQDLLAVLGPLGIVSPQGQLKAGGDTVQLPSPLAITYRVK